MRTGLDEREDAFVQALRDPEDGRCATMRGGHGSGVARRRLHENASYFTSPSGIIAISPICKGGEARVRIELRRVRSNRIELRTCSLSAFSLIAEMMGWSAATSTKRFCATSWMPSSQRFSAVYPGNFRENS